MKTVLRTSAVTAALLLAPVGAVLAQPAFGGSATVAVAPDHQRWHDSRWDRPVRRDQRAPVVSDLTPSQGDRVTDRGQTRISARVTDEGSGVDASTLALRIDGRDVSRHVRFDGDDVRYREDLRPGRHVAELSVRDRAGNVTRRSWTFDVIDFDRHGRRHARDDQRWDIYSSR